MGQILVTGATGNVGREVLRSLAERGVQARAGVRDPARLEGSGDRAASPVALDYGQPETFAPALEGVEAVFLVRPPALANVARYFDPFIAAAREAGVSRVAFLSVLGAERLRVVPHRRIERSLERSGLAYTHLRAGFFMQNLSTVHRDEIRLRDELWTPAGRGRTGFVDVRDLAAVAVSALTEPGHEGEAYDLTGAEALDYAEVAVTLSAVLGRPIAYAAPTVPAYLAGMRTRGYGPGRAFGLLAIYLPTRLGLAREVSPDLARLLGRAPTSVARFAEEYRDCWAG